VCVLGQAAPNGGIHGVRKTALGLSGFDL
jgi:hypothetical protein